MIPPTSSSQRPTAPAVFKSAGQAVSRIPLQPDRSSAEHAEFLHAELQRQPAARVDVVNRGRQLVADPGYPSPAIVRHVAQRLLAGPALAEDEAS